jgi:HEAT repeats
MQPTLRHGLSLVVMIQCAAGIAGCATKSNPENPATTLAAATHLASSPQGPTPPPPRDAKPPAVLPQGYWQATADQKQDLLRRMANGKEADAVIVLIELFRRETDIEVREEILELLGESQDARILETLSNAAGPGQPQPLRVAAIHAMGESEDARALAIVRKYLADPDQEIRTAADVEADYLTAGHPTNQRALDPK